LRQLLSGAAPHPTQAPINLSIGEPKRPTPQLVLDALAAGGTQLANYPMTADTPPLRDAITAWLRRRHSLDALDSATQVLPRLDRIVRFSKTRG